jgi:putative ABC transport system ATP-binding protein
MPGARVIAERVSRRYGQVLALYDVSFEVEPGELIALTGPSGSGKTTLLQLIGSLDRPSSGSIRVDDIAVEQLSNPTHFRRSIVGFVFQLHYLLPSLTVQQNAELPMIAAHVPRHERVERSLELLKEVGLDGRAANRPAELSGGERQRVAIARALAGLPRLILADEPTGSLDTAASHRVWKLLGDVRDRRGTTVIVASHDPSLTEHVDRELRIVDGHLVPAPDRSHSARELRR